jgi:thioredoxin-like negative regulator of GroEL
VHGLKTKYGKQITFIEVNTDEEVVQKAAEQMGVQGIPALFFFDAKGQPAGSIVGAPSEAQLEEVLKALK